MLHRAPQGPHRDRHRAGHSEQRVRRVLSETSTPSSNEPRRSGTKQRATARGWRPFSFLPLLTLATAMLGWPPRLPETGRSNELMKWELLAFPHLGNYNPPRTIEVIQHIGGEFLSQQCKQPPQSNAPTVPSPMKRRHRSARHNGP